MCYKMCNNVQRMRYMIARMVVYPLADGKGQEASPAGPALFAEAISWKASTSALADLAGGSWPERARRAAIVLASGANDSNPMSALLFDIARAFDENQEKRLFQSRPGRMVERRLREPALGRTTQWQNRHGHLSARHSTRMVWIRGSETPRPKAITSKTLREASIATSPSRSPRLA